MAKVITIAQQKGGAGKTSLAIHLSCALLERGKSIGLIDLDPQESLSAWFKLRRDTQGKDKDFTLRPASGWRAQSEIEKLKKDCDLVIIDSPPHAETAARLAIRMADLVVVPVQLSPMDIWASEPTLEMIAKERTKALVVMNRVPPRGRLADDLRQQLEDDELPLAKTTLGNRMAFAASLMEGLGITEFARSSTGAQEMLSLTDEVLARLKKDKG
jgi:chromosome partitioning protein